MCVYHYSQQCEDRTECDRLLMFIEKLLHHKQNVKIFLDANGMKMLVDLVTLAHLHTSRAYVPTQTTAIEASPDQHTDSEKEWYFSNKEKQREGPYSFREVCTCTILYHCTHAHQRAAGQLNCGRV